MILTSIRDFSVIMIIIMVITFAIIIVVMIILIIDFLRPYIYIYIVPPPVIYLFWGRLRKCLGLRAEVGQPTVFRV